LNKTLLFIISIIFISCNENPKLFKNGLTKNAKRIDEYAIKVKFDSVNNPIHDTLFFKVRDYNKKGNIIRNKLTMLFYDECIDVQFVYDSLDRVKKEIVRLHNDSSTFAVNYFYKDSLLRQTISESIKENYQSIQKGKYKYHSNKKLKEILLFQIYIDLEENDTISYTIELDKYNKDGVLVETEFNDFKNKLNNKKYRYKLNNKGMYDETKEFDFNDSLVSTTTAQYLLDKFGNWTEKKSYKNDTLIRINIRKIEY
jgi:hypothetical protein